MSLWKNYKGKINNNVPLAPMTTFKIGGNAEWFAEPKNHDELRDLLIDAEKKQIRFYVLGGGSNLLISDKGLDGIVISLTSDAFSDIEIDEINNTMTVGAGCSLSKVSQIAKNEGMAGIEYLAGIPGTIGGAVLMNAGSTGYAIGLRVKEVTVVDMAGRVSVLNRSNLLFNYRHSNLQDLIITEVKLDFRKDFPELIEKRYSLMIDKKNSTQPTDKFSAGCIFKNPPKISAGELIDRAGCKEWQEGGAEVSAVHANFIINNGNATYDDVVKLIDRVQKRVCASFGVMLDLEVKIWV